MKSKRIIIFLGVLIALPVACWVIYYSFNTKQEQLRLTNNLRAKAPGKFIQLQDGKTHYQLRGDSPSELILFIHGGGISGMEVWDKNVDYFVDHGFQTLTYDLYGRGYSDRPDTRQTPELFHNQISGLLDSLHISGPISIIALSMGAITALDLYSSHSNMINKVVLIDPIASGSFTPKSILTVPVLSDFILTTYWYPRAIKNQEHEFVNKQLFKNYSERLSFFMNIEGYKQTNISTWKHMLTQNKMNILSSVGPDDVIILFGDQDPYFGYGQQHQYLSNFPSIRMIEIDSAGHMPQYEHPGQVNKLVLDYLTDRQNMRL